MIESLGHQRAQAPRQALFGLKRVLARACQRASYTSSGAFLPLFLTYAKERAFLSIFYAFASHLRCTHEQEEFGQCCPSLRRRPIALSQAKRREGKPVEAAQGYVAS
jgi:hypothetical protein